MSNTTRFGLVGLGNIGKVHMGNFASGKIRSGTLTAVCDQFPPSFELPADVRFFGTVDAMLESGTVDAVIVATPHPLHNEFGTKVLKHGTHLMMEKPLTATKLDGEKLLSVPRRPGQKFGIMMNLRTHPHFRRIKSLITGGELGELERVQWTITNWFRTEAYYHMSDWRATWKGEGGGVLINQSLHNLDILQWLCGMPTKLRADCRFGHSHDIEVEDHVVAFLEYENGACGTFTTSTGEAPGVNRLEIAGTKGLVVLEDNKLRLRRNSVDSREYLKTSDNAFGAPETEEEIFGDEEPYPSHAGVLSNFAEAVQGTAELMVEAEEGLNSVELANAMVFSTWEDRVVTLPLDSAAYEAALQGKIASSPPRERTIRAAKVDMSKSYS